MNDECRANQELIEEISTLKQRIKDLEQSELERKRVNEALRESEEKYRFIAENTVDIITIMDMDLRFTYVSPSVLRIRGFTIEEAIEQTLDQVLTPESLQIALSVFAEEMKLEVSGTADPNRIRILELEEYKKDGSLVWVEVSLSYLRDKDGRPTGILALSRNITERMQTEEALRQSEEKYRFIAENTADIISIIDMELQFTYASPSLKRIRGYSHEEAAGQTLEQILTPESLQTALAVFVEEMELEASGTADPGRIRILESQVYRRDGSKIWLESSLSYLRDRDGVPTGILAVARDITDRKKVEETLQQKNKELAAINQLARAVTSRLSLEEVCQAAVQQVGQALNPDATVLFVREGEDLCLKASVHAPRMYPIENMPVHRVGECLCGIAVSTKQPIYVTNILADPRCTWQECRNAGMFSFAAIPLNLGDKPIGLLGIASATERDFTLSAGYLEAAADQIAISIRNTQLLDETRAYASRLQQTITELKRAEEALLLNAQRNQALLQLGQMTEVSQQEITGFALEEALLLTKSKIGYLAFLNEDETVLAMNN